MVKKSIIAIAMLGMLATVTLAQDLPTPQVTGQLKIDGGWPKICQWAPIEICCIKINLKIGYFIEVDNCGNKVINMVQVNCPTGQSFPCYKGCLTGTTGNSSALKVRSNFNAILGLKLYASSPIINDNGTPTNPNDDKWKAYFRADASDTTQNATWLIIGDGNYHSVDVCVEAWDANIFGGTPGQNPQVGTVCITAIPEAAATCP